MLTLRTGRTGALGQARASVEGSGPLGIKRGRRASATTSSGARWRCSAAASKAIRPRNCLGHCLGEATVSQRIGARVPRSPGSALPYRAKPPKPPYSAQGTGLPRPTPEVTSSVWESTVWGKRLAGG